jgi:purine nucleosidase
MKVWIDTDIGGDIDDALALTYALANPKAEIVGVSTVFENTKARARIAKTICTLGGRPDIRVYAGLGKPRKATSVFSHSIESSNLPETYKEKDFGMAQIEIEGAVNALAEALTNYPGEITVISLGALSNISALMEIRPEAAAKAKCFYIMGGAIGLNLNEFNFTCDPESTSTVISSSYQKYVTSLDVTFQCALSEEQISIMKACHSPLLKMVMEMHKRWGAGMILHDPLTACEALGGHYVSYAPGNLYIEKEGRYSRGKCVNLCDFNWNKKPRDDLNLSTAVDKTSFIAHFIKTIKTFDTELCGKYN